MSAKKPARLLRSLNLFGLDHIDRQREGRRGDPQIVGRLY